MTRKQYFIATKDGKIEVKGYPVVIPGFEEFEFFAHRPYGYYNGRNNPPYFCNEGWNISEAITGLNVSPDSWAGGMNNSTRAGALAIVVERFKSMGRDFILPKLQSSVKAAQDTSMEVK